MIHVGLHSVGTYHKNFGRQNQKNKNILCRVSRKGTRQRRLFAECQPLAPGKDWRPSALGRPLTALCREPPLPSVWHSANMYLPSVNLYRVSYTLGKHARYREPSFTECGSRQSRLCRVPEKKHSAKCPALGKGSDSGSGCFNAVVTLCKQENPRTPAAFRFWTK
jgi:hypothetical protein